MVTIKNTGGYLIGKYDNQDTIDLLLLNSDNQICNIEYTGNFKVPRYNGTIWIEDMTQQDLDDYNENKISEIKKEYAFKIANIEGYREATQNLTFDSTPIPAEITSQRNALIIERDNKINDL